MRSPARLTTAALAVSAALLVAPDLAHACAVCGGNTPEAQRIAFIVTTGLLTFLPLGMLGGLFYWIRKRVRELEPPRPRRESPPST